MQAATSTARLAGPAVPLSSDSWQPVSPRGLLGVALTYFAAGWCGLQIPYLGTHISLFWLPTGLAVSALFSWGRPCIVAIYLGAFAINLYIGSSWQLAASIAVGNSLGPLLTDLLLKRCRFQPSFHRQSDVGWFVLAAASGMAISASAGVASLAMANMLLKQSIGATMLAWWMGDTAGVLLFAPVLWSLSRKNVARLVQNRLALAAWLAVAMPVAWLAFIQDYSSDGLVFPFIFLTLPILAWAAVRFGMAGAALAGFALSATAAWGTATGHGKFLVTDSHLGLFLLWAYMISAVLTGLLITALQADRQQTADSLRETVEKLQGLFELSPLGIALTDMAGRFIDFNPAFELICGYPRNVLMTLEIWQLTPETYRDDEARQLADLTGSGRYGPYEKQYLRPDGSLVAVQVNGMLVNGPDSVPHVWSIVENITLRKSIDADVRIAAVAFESQEGMLVTDAQGRVLRVNGEFVKITGYAIEEVLGTTPTMLRSDQHDAGFYAAMFDTIASTGVWKGDLWVQTKNCQTIPLWLAVSAVTSASGQVTHYIGVFSDISQRKDDEEQIRHLAYFDSLTGLPNRRLMLDRLSQALIASDRSQEFGALLILDLDNFKALNDTQGHGAGDRLLIEVACRIVASIREEDSVSRLGGDEFLVMVEGLGQDETAAASKVETIAEKIRRAHNEPYRRADLGPFDHSSVSIGVALFCGNDSGGDVLIKQADMALYQAKAAGRNTVRFFNPAMQSAIETRSRMESALRFGLQHQEFRLVYQPQLDYHARFVGAEALLRWTSRDHGPVSPVNFIPAAEESGLILPLGLWVLQAACKQLVHWAQDPLTAALRMSINVSARQFRQLDFVEQIKDAVSVSGANPHLLRLELTESVVLENIDDVVLRMLQIKALGVTFSLDDFGTGFSSLSYLKRLPLDEVKIDQSFVRDLSSDPNDAAIVRAIIAMGRSLGLQVIAEGVETAVQLSYLKANGCSHFQGYLFGQPCAVEEFEAALLNANDPDDMLLPTESESEIAAHTMPATQSVG